MSCFPGQQFRLRNLATWMVSTAAMLASSTPLSTTIAIVARLPLYGSRFLTPPLALECHLA